MKILVLGGDGFCGWPTTLHLSNIGHDVIIVDNLSRRKIDIELEVESLTPIAPMSTRLEAWASVSGKQVEFRNIDISKQYQRLLDLIIKEDVDAIIHFAEQRAAPYSMKGSKGKRYTVDNNLNATNNVLCAIVESGRDIHLIHLGTMGVYGYGTAGMKIPEGYLSVQVMTDKGDTIEQEILYPANPGSIYHMTKTQDALCFAFYNKNDDLRITDLHQGIVWGTHTDETLMDERLINRFDYDGDYGTVLNRFLMQAAVGHPLTVHGTGGQTRAFIHIKDTVKCIEMALSNPPKKGDKVMIFNQMTETHQVNKLAELIASLTNSDIAHLPNPRKEAVENELHVENKCFLELGLNPTTLKNGLLLEVKEIAQKFAHRCDHSKILCKSYWTQSEQQKSESLNVFTSLDMKNKANSEHTDSYKIISGLSRMKILVTGGCGFIGANLVAMLRAQGHSITILDNFSRGSSDYLDDKTAYEIVKADIRNEHAVTQAAQGRDAIIHLAAYGSVVESITAPEENFSVNAEGTFSVLNAARKAGVSQLIFSSTGGALIGNSIPPVNEQSVPRPISPYGASKLAGEGYCCAFANAYDMSITAMRFANVVGPISWHKKGAVTAFFKAIMTKQPIHIYGDGSATRDFLYVEDLCRGIIAGLDAKKQGFNTYHLASGREVSVKELADIACHAASTSDYPITFDPKRKGEVERNFANYELAQQELGFSPSTTVEKAMQITWLWFKEYSQQTSKGD